MGKSDDIDDFARRINLWIPLNNYVWYRGQRRLFRDIVSEWWDELQQPPEDRDQREPEQPEGE